MQQGATNHEHPNRNHLSIRDGIYLALTADPTTAGMLR